MRQHLLRTILPLAVLLSGPAEAQTPVEIAFQTDPVQVQTGTDILFTVINAPIVFTMTWQYQGGVTLGLWVNGAPSVKPMPQFQGRVTITATTLRIGSAALADGGQYTVEVDPAVSTGLGKNSKSVQLNVFDAVTGVNLFVPPVSIEGKNISLTCTHQTGTDITFLWTKDGTTLAPSARITITRGSLVINPGQRSDAGDYTCTVSNPVSARTAKQTLTVYFGPDTPVLTKDTAKDCVGVGDVWTGKTITLTCTSTSLPLAQFSWQFNGKAISSPDTGQLSLQTSATNQSGRYTCTAKNSVTGLSSKQGADLVVTDVCLDVGEVVGVVIGSLILLILLIILIILLVRYIIVRRRRREASTVQKTNANPKPIPENPAANVGRDLAQGPQPPQLYHASAEPRRANHLYTAPVPGRNGDGQRPTRNAQNNSATSWHNGIPLANGLQHNAIQNSNNPTLHNGIDNPAFTRNELQAAPQQQTQNPNIVIQTGSAQVRLNTLQGTAQQNNNGQIPTIHVNLNSYSGDQQTPIESVALPVTSTAIDEATQTPQNERRAASTLRTPMLDRHRAVLQTNAGQIPTGYTHYNRNNTVERNTEMEVFNQQSESRGRSDSSSSQPASRRQLPWDTLRGTPSYPSNNQRRITSDSTDYTEHPPLPQARSRSRERQEMQRTSENRRPSREREIERRSPRDDMRGRRESRAPRQEGRRDNSPPALPLMSQDSPAGRPLVQNQPDMRALVDPNHLPHSQASRQSRQVPQMEPISNRMTVAANQIPQVTNQMPQSNWPPDQIPQSRPQRPQSQLTQEALQAHTERAQTFQNRRQQTQAALFHPGPQANRVPTPPPVIPLQQFQALPVERTRQKEARPPVNMPVAQRPHHAHHRHHTAMPQNQHQHHQTHRQTHHQAGHKPTQAPTWQAHRGRPR
ncbi:uncharacterized protein [Eucyclogobius newberryi]|uniref:uncharacterized protein isoform X2 n=1 Tax=Eucyclogobius newberryi TaxID=166745 RepID=UPI003B5C4020